MKIVSKFRDYYDSVSHQYLDKAILYIRDERIIEIRREDRDIYPEVAEAHYYNSSLVGLDGWHFLVSYRIMGFCGVLYPFLVLKQEKVGGETKKHFFYSFEDFQAFARLWNLKLDSGIRRWRWGRSYDTKYMGEYENFFKNRENYTRLEAKFHELNTPCFLFREGDGQKRKIVVNPMLKKYGFQKVKDPFSAHQELYQFVGGYLKQPTNPMAEISDKDKIHKHGFDKWSFRQKGPKK